MAVASQGSLVNGNATGTVQASCKGVGREVAHLAGKVLLTENCPTLLYSFTLLYI